MKSDEFSPERLAADLERLGVLPDSPVLVGFSGGLDSTALLHALSRLKWPAVRAIHINHDLHPWAERWSEHAASAARNMGVVCDVVTVVVRAMGKGTEAAARAARYEALRAHMRETESLVVAHHAHDQAETLLLQLLRGAGLRGAGGMVPVRSFGPGRLVRPLLNVGRPALAAYVAREGLGFVEDPSNRETRFARNYLRQKVWPVIERRWPLGYQAMGRASAHLQAAERLLEAYVGDDLRRCRHTSGDLLVPPFLALSADAQPFVLRLWIQTQGGPALTEHKCREILKAIAMVPRSHHQVLRLGENYTVRRYRDRVSWGATPLSVLKAPGEGLWRPPSDYRIEGDGRRLVIHESLGLGLRVDRLAAKTLSVSGRVLGARVFISGRGHRPLKKFLQELGIAPWERDSLILVFDGPALIAIPGFWLCDSYRAGPHDRGWVLGVEPPESS